MPRRLLGVIGPLMLLVAATGACSGENGGVATPPKPFCEAAYHFDQRTGVARVGEQIRDVAVMASHAPIRIAGDTQTFLDALRRAAAGDRSVVGNARIEAAVRRVERYASNGCGFFQSDASQGF